jgi:opacity protein-like surface antigen
MKRFLGAIALACAISVSAQAGDVPTAGVTSPAPGDVPTAGISSPAPTRSTLPGDLPTAGFAEQVSDAVLSALLSVLAW